MKQESRWILRFRNYEKAFSKLSEISKMKDQDELVKMAMIQAFEYTIELGWKTMKDYLNEEGFVLNSPKETIRQAFISNLISDADVWIESIEIRNKASHAYDEKILTETTDYIQNRFFPAATSFYENIKIKLTVK